MWQVADFNSHAHVERDVPEPCHHGTVSYFNSHAHVERDCLTQTYLLIFPISTHTLTWSVTVDSTAGGAQYINFNSHAHVERDAIQRMYDGEPYISTHTLTWSVTTPHTAQR